MTHPDNASQSNQSVAGTSHHPRLGHHHPQMTKASPSSVAIDLNASQSYNCVEICSVCMTWFLFIMFFPIAIFQCHVILREYQRAVVLRLGRVHGGPKGPGIYFAFPCIETVMVSDMRSSSFDVPAQLVLTKDSLSIVIDAVVFYRIFDPILAATQIQNYNTSTQLLATTTIRHVLGTRTLTDILADRPGIARATRDALDDATDPWGIKVERVEIKSIQLPDLLKNSMAAEGEATRIAKGKIVAAEGEVKASRALQEAGDILRSSEGASKLRQLLMIERVGSTNNVTFVVPIGFMNSR